DNPAHGRDLPEPLYVDLARGENPAIPASIDERRIPVFQTDVQTVPPHPAHGRNADKSHPVPRHRPELPGAGNSPAESTARPYRRPVADPFHQKPWPLSVPASYPWRLRAQDAGIVYAPVHAQ